MLCAADYSTNVRPLGPGTASELSNPFQSRHPDAWHPIPQAPYLSVSKQCLAACHN